MPAEQVLIVEDNPINLRLTQILLLHEGYTIQTAGDAEEALSVLGHNRFDLMLVDIQLPGMDGLELTRRVKANPGTRNIVVVALTAYAMKGDEQRALESGCDGYITKPIDARKLGLRLRELFSKRAPHAQSAPQRGFAAADSEVEALRRRFLAEGLEQSQELLDGLLSAFDPASASRSAHQWIGAGGLFGFTRISELARETELALKERPLDIGQVRESLTALVGAFSDEQQALRIDAREKVREAISGRRIALAGFTDGMADRLYRCGYCRGRIDAP
jgi:two-component system cell cycle response regulator DivK